MRTLGLVLAIVGLLLVGATAALYPTAHPPLTAAQELERSALRLAALTGRAPVDHRRLARLEMAGETDPERVETRWRLILAGLGIGAIGALLVLASAITSVVRRQQV
ncbi:MAG: hypothetical protein ACK4Z0_05840 [Sphingomonadaceae bacterium]